MTFEGLNCSYDTGYIQLMASSFLRGGIIWALINSSLPVWGLLISEIVQMSHKIMAWSLSAVVLAALVLYGSLHLSVIASLD